jgi:hypothetical protein
MIASQLAPIVHLHPKETFFPCSADWYLSRCDLVLSPSDKAPTLDFSMAPGARPLKMTGEMKIVRAGPLDSFNFEGYRSERFGSAANTDRLFLWPMEGNRESDLRSSSKLYDYQRETAYGFRESPASAPCYCNIVSSIDRTRHRISYYFFYGYNGGLGPTAEWDGEPLGWRCGYGAHFGDWERVTVLVETGADLRNVKVKAVMGEQHGDEIVFSTSDDVRPVEQLDRIEVYSAWHSHATYPDTGTHHSLTDFTEKGGVAWDTRQTLMPIYARRANVLDEFADPFGGRPAWVYFNGDWGPRVVLSDGTVVSLFEGVLVGGPAGPAFQDFWTAVPESQPGVPTP